MRAVATRMAWISVWALGVSACGGGGDNQFAQEPPPGSGLTVGGSVTGLNNGATVVLQNNGGNNLSVTTNGNFRFSTSLATGTNYSVTVGTQPNAQTCTVANGTGTIGSAAVTNVSVLCTPQIGKFVYVPNANSNSVSAYSINASTGALTAIGSPVAAAQTPTLATADPAGKFLYVINRGNGITPPQISSYAIGANGALTQNTASPFPVTNSLPPASPAFFNKPIVDSSGRFVYLTNNVAPNGMLYGVSADATGTLTEVPGMPQNVGDFAGFGEFDRNGTFLYLPHNSFNFTPNAGAVAIFKFNPNSGVLTSQGSVGTGATRPDIATLTPSGKFLLVTHRLSNASSGPGRVAVLSVDASSGIPTPVAGSPFSTGGLTTFVVAHPTKNFIYANSAAADNTSAIAAFQIDPNTGALTPVTGSPFATGGKSASFIRIGAAGKFLYVANFDSNTISGFAIDQTSGALTAVPGSPFATDGNPEAAIDPSGRYLYSTNSASTANTIASYAINPTTGALTLVNKLATGTFPVMAEVAGRQ